jgi:hypothetical protein
MGVFGKVGQVEQNIYWLVGKEISSIVERSKSWFLLEL